MESRKIYMIHEVNDEILKKILKLDSSSVLTFDDGLYTSFKYHEHFDKFTRVIFFISSSIICTDGDLQSKKFITCSEAHKKAFKGNFENYMTLNQIKELQSKGFEIGSHSHNHLRFKTIKVCIDDIQESLNFFKKQEIKIKSYCFPYNQDYQKPYLSALIKKKFPELEIFGSNRIPLT